MPMRYYFIDFGISTKFEESDTDRRVLGKLGLDKDVPELDDYIEYEAFPVDVFILGNVYRQVFVEVSFRLISVGKLNKIVVNSNT